ncbi:hypothetical protein pipiens_003021 [Culex pipiens pipiens]|uniref:DNA-directed RNA polymerase III subunit RPC5 n=1 Tax=Culex pipiens pipiens TaxID=38569 RepID=A0ABD1D4P0_CULPP
MPGVGKTTIMRHVGTELQRRAIAFDGFYTEELRSPSGERSGFDIVTFDGKRAPLARTSDSVRNAPAKNRVGKYTVCVAEFESVALPALAGRTTASLLLLDEIGKMELKSRPFEDRLQQIVNAVAAPPGAVMDEEDDPVVEEIPVYLSKTLAENLYLLQYPVKASTATFDDGQVVNSCVKPINQQIKVDYALNTASKNYDSFKGEQFAIAADGKEKDRQQKPTFRSGTMDKQSFLSSKPIEDVNRYMVCTLQDREIHATPLQGIASMRQMFSYFDKQDKRTKAEQKAEQDADADEEELKQVTVKFARTENEKVRKAREKSFNYISKLESEEPWCETFWHAKTSTAAELERQKLFCGGTGAGGASAREDPAALNVAPPEYLEMLISKEKTDRNIDSMLPSRVVCMHKLKQMALVDQIKVILKDAKVLTFQQIMDLLPDRGLAADKVLRTLPLAGVLIRGNWVVQSEIMYPEGSVSAINGVPAEQMCKARDYILYRFTQSDHLERHQLALITQLPTEEIREILCSVARLNPDRTWSLLLPSNEEFSANEQEISDRQNAFWTARADKFNEMERSTKRVRKRSGRSESKYDVKMSNG